MAQHAPGRLQDWLRYASRTKELSALDPKTRELIIIAIDSLTQWKYLDGHVEAALDHGATVEEIIEVLVVVGYLKGPHAWVSGLEALGRVLAARETGVDPGTE
jgi:AhpD family alkylhydroperoxidase